MHCNYVLNAIVLNWDVQAFYGVTGMKMTITYSENVIERLWYPIAIGKH